MNIIAIIQSRMGSTRLPKKVLKTIFDKPLLSYLIERCRHIDGLDNIIVATTKKKEDDPIIDLCRHLNTRYFRGNEHNVLERYYQAALAFQGDVIVRITGDCPLIDPLIVTELIQQFTAGHYDYLSNVFPTRTYPKGLDVEIMTFNTLKKVYQKASDTYEQEHVTPYIHRNPDEFKIDTMALDEDLSQYNVSVDTLEDFEKVSFLIKQLYSIKPYSNLNDLKPLLQA